MKPMFPKIRASLMKMELPGSKSPKATEAADVVEAVETSEDVEDFTRTETAVHRREASQDHSQEMTTGAGTVAIRTVGDNAVQLDNHAIHVVK